MGRCRQSKAGRGNCRTMQTVEKQLVLEENWQVLAVVFPPFAQRLENSVSRACWPGSMSLGVFHSSHGLCYCSRLYGQANGGADLGSGRCQPRPHLPIYRMTQRNFESGRRPRAETGSTGADLPWVSSSSIGPTTTTSCGPAPADTSLPPSGTSIPTGGRKARLSGLALGLGPRFESRILPFKRASH